MNARHAGWLNALFSEHKVNNFLLINQWPSNLLMSYFASFYLNCTFFQMNLLVMGNLFVILNHPLCDSIITLSKFIFVDDSPYYIFSSLYLSRHNVPWQTSFVIVKGEQNFRGRSEKKVVEIFFLLCQDWKVHVIWFILGK